MKFVIPNFWRKNSLATYLLLPFTIITTLIIFLKKNKNPYVPKINSICIGNIYLGGTGKTSLVVKINEILKEKYKTFVIKKYYKNQIDEQRLLDRKTKLILPENRIQGIQQIENSTKNIAIFDDGLQDKTINYKNSIVCFNSYSGIGNGRILPAGPLREKLAELKKYNAVFINGETNIFLEKQLKYYKKNIKIFRGKYILKNKRTFDLKKKYLAFCGIGTPESFFKLLEDNGIKIENKIIFPDHFNYNSTDIRDIKKMALKRKLKIVTTEKDYMKIYKFKNINVNVAKVDLKIDKFQDFRKFLIRYL